MTGFSKQSKDRPFLLGVAGGSGSGKTYFAQALQNRLGPGNCEIVYQDCFYIDQSKRFDHDGGSVNFDHPNAIDFALLANRLVELRAGHPTEIPIYDFVTHQRREQTIKVHAVPIIVVDGILIFHSEPVRGLFDDMIFFETPEDLRYQRRLERDVKERGRTPEGVRSQFLNQVKPMHDQFVAPSMAHANRIVQTLAEFDSALESICRRFDK